jgi:NADP-dependent 3-hydroxy acid dehydrogenase YdfG
MVRIQEVKTELSTLKRLGPGLVAVFVGGTSGIGENTAREIVRHSTSPRIYLVGRSQEQADRIKADFQTINPEAQTRFIKGDVSSLRNVDKICDEIKQSENKINLLFLTAGILTMSGRNGLLHVQLHCPFAKG